METPNRHLWPAAGESGGDRRRRPAGWQGVLGSPAGPEPLRGRQPAPARCPGQRRRARSQPGRIPRRAGCPHRASSPSGRAPHHRGGGPGVRGDPTGGAGAGRGRQARLAGVARVGGDAAVIALAAVAVWQLRHFSAVPRTTGGGLGIDPVLAVAPALALAGAALIPVRLIPLIARGADVLSARSRRLAGALTGWQISRRPIRQAGPVLLVILAVATGTVALAQHQTWRRAATDQAAFAVGADVRAGLPRPLPAGGTGAVAGLRGVTGAMAVTSFPGGNGESVLALDARAAAGAGPLRPAPSRQPAARLWRQIAPTPPR